MSKPSPRTLDGWTEELDRQHLPISPARQSRLVHLLHDQRRPLRDITDQLQQSPTVALALLREANRNLGDLNQQAESLEIALPRLGLQRAAELIGRLPLLSEQEQPRMLRQLLLISQHAGHLANGLFTPNLSRLWQEIHGNALLFLAPLWSVAASHPELMDAWEQRVLGRSEPARKVEEQLFGVTLSALSLHLAEHWHLPEWISHGYRLLLEHREQLAKSLHIARDNDNPLLQQRQLDADPALRRWLTQPANTALLANGLALSAHVSWGCEHNLRWQRQTSLYLQRRLDEVQQSIHQHSAASARQIATPGLWHPAAALLWPWNDSHLRPAEPLPPATSLQDWRARCGELLQQPSPFLNVVQLTACARDALVACGLPRTLLLLRQRDQLRAQQYSGLPAAARDLELTSNASVLLQRLLSQPGQLHLTPANAGQYSALLPEPLRVLFPGEHLLLRSVAHNGQVLVLLVADNAGAPLDDIRLRAFAKTAQCLERALDTFARRGR